MRSYSTALLLVLAAALLTSGCDQVESVPANPPAPTPLSLDEWRKLPMAEKYDEAFLERVRMSKPELKSDRAWKAFMDKEILPERKKDIPSKPAAS